MQEADAERIMDVYGQQAGHTVDIAQPAVDLDYDAPAWIDGDVQIDWSLQFTVRGPQTTGVVAAAIQDEARKLVTAIKEGK